MARTNQNTVPNRRTNRTSSLENSRAVIGWNPHRSAPQKHPTVAFLRSVPTALNAFTRWRHPTHFNVNSITRRRHATISNPSPAPIRIGSSCHTYERDIPPTGRQCPSWHYEKQKNTHTQNIKDTISY